MTRVVLIGNRCGAYSRLGEFPGLELMHVYALRESYLDHALPAEASHVRRFGTKEKAEILHDLEQRPFEVLISQGCPFVLPISRLRRAGRRFLNVHPSYLPRLQGKHPANGALLFGEQFAGATLHEMEVRVDAGRIIHQEKFPLTADIDLPLLYDLLFDLEVRVFETGMRKLIDSHFEYQGEEPRGEGSYYSRRADDMRIDFADQSNAEIERRVRAFGLPAQGVAASIDGQPARVFAAEQVVNPYLLTRFSSREPGESLLKYDGAVLVKSRDGSIKVTRLSMS